MAVISGDETGSVTNVLTKLANAENVMTAATDHVKAAS